MGEMGEWAYDPFPKKKNPPPKKLSLSLSLTAVCGRLRRDVELQEGNVRLGHGRAQLARGLVLVPSQRGAVGHQEIDKVSPARSDGLQESAPAKGVPEARVPARTQQRVDRGGVARAGREHETGTSVVVDDVDAVFWGDFLFEKKREFEKDE